MTGIEPRVKTVDGTVWDYDGREVDHFEIQRDYGVVELRVVGPDGGVHGKHPYQNVVAYWIEKC